MPDKPTAEDAEKLPAGPLKIQDSFTLVISRAGNNVNICAVLVDPESNSIIPATGDKALRMSIAIVGALLNDHNAGRLTLADAVVKGHPMNPHQTKPAPTQH